ncbi:MAG: ATP-binding cassette domain-containing protein [Oscillospiraceae bacterium]|nr:ATP-binding cassette domain-containing protein [Oscillospiraceae bacterium]
MTDNASIIELKDLSFYYPEQEKPTLEHISLTVHEGEFLVLCGPSGCGKSTLMRQLKTVMAPHGVREGEILFMGAPLDDMDHRAQSSKIGFVQQSPDNQIVTDKVWHELAFGLESLGFDTPTIRRRVSEMASFFGIQTWFYKNVTELSGGQKQLLNLAAIMVMQPEVLILDEPTSQLDPIAASDFLATIGKINRELGTTIILTEHRLEDAFPIADTVAVMDKGRMLCAGTPQQVGQELKTMQHSMFLAMPAPMRIWAAVDSDAQCPITVNQGREWLTEYAGEKELGEIPPVVTHVYPNERVIRANELWFKYEKDAPDVVKGLSLEVKKGEFLALLGGNGTGKTTSIKLIAGLQKAYRGDIEIHGTVGVLPQNPQTLFVKKTVRDDLEEILKGIKLSAAEKWARVSHIIKVCRLEELLERHPYDLSGGEQQRAALAKVLLLEPEILLMDEPTKGLDAEFKEIFAEILQMLIKRGVTVLMVSHDIEFCARYAHRCALFFDGNIVADGTPRAFFSGNNFYTTSANRMSRAVLSDAVTAEDVIAACGGELPESVEIPDDEGYVVPEKDDESVTVKRLPLWRKLVAAGGLALALYAFIATISVTDLSAVFNESGLTGLAGVNIRLIVLLVAGMFIFALAIGKRAKKPVEVQTPLSQRKLTKRTIAATIIVLLLIPLTLFVGSFYMGGKKYYLISVLILVECMLPFFMVFENRKPQARELVVIAVLCALGVVGRAAFFMLPQFKPVMAVAIIAGVSFGAESGFLVGSLSMLVSDMMFSQGIWMPWQMFTMGIIGFLSGILFKKGMLRRNKESLCVYGAICAIVIYGGVMNFATAVMVGSTLDLKSLLPFYVVGIPVDCIHAAATALAIWFAAEPMMEKLDRIKVKYGLVE